MKLHLRDLSGSLVAAWRDAFAGAEGVEISQGDIFSTKRGIINEGDPIDVRADAVVSPANSFGFMDGGIDAVFTYQLGPQVQTAVQSQIARDWAGELPVGQALIVSTGRAEIPFCISAPTMRSPSVVANTVNAYLALRAALLAVLAHNEAGNAAQIKTVLSRAGNRSGPHASSPLRSSDARRLGSRRGRQIISGLRRTSPRTAPLRDPRHRPTT